MAISKISSKFPKFYAMLVFVLASSFTIYEFALRVMPSAMTQQLMSSFSIDARGLGMMASLFFYGYSPMQIPAGLLYDRIGPRRLLALNTLLCAFSGLIFGYASNIYIASIARFLTGFTASFAFIGALLIAARWYPPSRFAFFTGLIQFLGCTGAVIGEAPIAAMVTKMGWRPTTVWFSVIGIVLALIMYAVVRDYPNNKSVTKPKHIPSVGVLKGLKRVCRNGQTWWIGLYAFCCWAPISVFATLWGPSFLARAYNVSMTKATALTSLVWIAIGIGSPIAGWWSNRIQRRCRPLIILAVIGLASSITMLYINDLPKWLLSLMLLLFGASASSQVITFGLVLDNNHDTVMGTAAGFNNMAVVAGGILLQPLVGIIIDYMWKKNPLYLGSSPLYSLTEYHTALIVIPLCFITGIITSVYFIRETRCVRDHVHHHYGQDINVQHH
ncbi:MAG: MFS transporter [Coxiellaceae bacterium]|nr:MFS transporter [Coxiellaceae bacterium]